MGQSLAKLLRSGGLIGILLEILTHGRKEVLTPHVVHHRVDDDCATVIYGGAIVSHIQRHVIERYPVIRIVAPSVDAVDQSRNSALEVLFAINAHFVKCAPELREALVEPHVARIGASHQVARPHVRELMGQVFLIVGVAADDAGGQGNVVGVFHAALARADVTNTVERIRAEVLLKEGDNLVDMCKSARDSSTQTWGRVNLYRDVALNAVIHIFP